MLCCWLNSVWLVLRNKWNMELICWAAVLCTLLLGSCTAGDADLSLNRSLVSSAATRDDAMRCDATEGCVGQSIDCHSSEVETDAMLDFQSVDQSFLGDPTLVQCRPLRNRSGSLQVTQLMFGQRRLPSTSTHSWNSYPPSLCYCIYHALCSGPCSCGSPVNVGG